MDVTNFFSRIVAFESKFKVHSSSAKTYLLALQARKRCLFGRAWRLFDISGSLESSVQKSVKRLNEQDV